MLGAPLNAVPSVKNRPQKLGNYAQGKGGKGGIVRATCRPRSDRMCSVVVSCGVSQGWIGLLGLGDYRDRREGTLLGCWLDLGLSSGSTDSGSRGWAGHGGIAPVWSCRYLTSGA